MMWPFSKRSPLDARTIEARLPREVAAVLAAAGVPRFRDALPRMLMEVERARRYRRSLAVALFAVDAATEPGTNGAGQQYRSAASAPPSVLALNGSLHAALLGSILRELVRETDIVAFAAALGRCTLVMPEIGAEEARLATRRLRGWCSERLVMGVRAEVAIFPQDGLTLEELITLVDSRWDVLEQPHVLRGAAESS